MTKISFSYSTDKEFFDRYFVFLFCKTEQGKKSVDCDIERDLLIKIINTQFQDKNKGFETKYLFENGAIIKTNAEYTEEILANQIRKQIILECGHKQPNGKDTTITKVIEFFQIFIKEISNDLSVF